MDDTPRTTETPFVSYAYRSEWVSLADLFAAMSAALPAGDDESKMPAEMLGASWEALSEFLCAATEGAIEVRAVDPDNHSRFIPRADWWYYKSLELSSDTALPRLVSVEGCIYDYLDVRRADVLRVWPDLRLGACWPTTPQSDGEGEADAAIAHPHSTDPDDPKEAAVHEWLMSRHKLEKQPLKFTDEALRKECMEKFSISSRQYNLIFRGLPVDVRYAHGGHNKQISK